MKKLLLLWALWLVGPSLAAQTGALTAWELKTAHSQFTFVGSIHLATPEMYPLDPRLEQAFAAADHLVVEVDLSRVDQASVAQKTLALGSYPAGQSLDTALPLALVQKLQAYLKTSGLAWEMVKTYRPWMIATLVSMLQLQAAGLTGAPGIDQHFIEAASRQAKPIAELETVDFQLNLLAGLPDNLTIAALTEGLDEPETPQKIRQMVDFWRTGQTQALYDLLFPPDASTEAKAYQAAFLTRRNQAWLTKLQELDRQGGAWFVVAGAGHFIGPDSVIELLIKAGWTPKQIGGTP